jgi:hypothetical protein
MTANPGTQTTPQQLARIVGLIWTDDVRRLFDDARGAGASRQSYTGRGRRFPDMT